MLTRWRVATSLAPAAEEASGANIVDRRRTSLQHREVLGRRTLLLRIVAPRRQQVQVRVLGTRCGSEACRAVVGHASCCEMGAAVVGRGASCCEMGAAVVGRGLLLCVAVLAGRKLLQITDLIADALLSVAPWHWRTDCRPSSVTVDAAKVSLTWVSREEQSCGKDKSRRDCAFVLLHRWTGVLTHRCLIRTERVFLAMAEYAIRNTQYAIRNRTEGGISLPLQIRNTQYAIAHAKHVSTGVVL